MREQVLFDLLTQLIMFIEEQTDDPFCSNCKNILDNESPDGSRICLQCGARYTLPEVYRLRSDRLYEIWSHLIALTIETKAVLLEIKPNEQEDKKSCR